MQPVFIKGRENTGGKTLYPPAIFFYSIGI